MLQGASNYHMLVIFWCNYIDPDLTHGYNLHPYTISMPWPEFAVYINNFLVFSSLLLVRVESLSCFHPKFALTDQLVHHLHWLEERIVWETLMPTCTWEARTTHVVSIWWGFALLVTSAHLMQASHHHLGGKIVLYRLMFGKEVLSVLINYIVDTWLVCHLTPNKTWTATMQ